MHFAVIFSLLLPVRRRRFVVAVGAAALSLASPTFAQSVSAELDAVADETIQLSPFVIQADADGNSYRADSTLAGTRVKTDMADIASSISVITSQFLEDIGATDSETLLQYTTNTEVGGTQGNFAGLGNTFVNGAGEGTFGNINPANRVRGLGSADNTRDYFLTDIPWDSYSVGRVDIQRGPNSILFGIGSPAGIINASMNTANLRNRYEVSARVSSFGSVRGTADFNHVIVPDELAIRVALLDDNNKFRQDPAYSHAKRYFGAVRYAPKFLNSGKANTTFRANFEHGNIDSNYPRVIPPTDQITPFFGNEVNKTTYDLYYAYATGVIPATQDPIYGEAENYWLGAKPLGTQFGVEPRISYDAVQAGTPTILATQKPPAGNSAVTLFAIGPDGSPDSTIGGYPFRSGGGISNYNGYTIAVNRDFPDRYPGASSGFYKAYVLTDPTIFDFYNHLIDGPNKWEAREWDAANFAVEQTFFNNRLGFELVYDMQDYVATAESNGIQNRISVDMITNDNFTLPWAYGSVNKYDGTGQAGSNANAGRAYVGSGGGSGYSRETERRNTRVTAFADVRFDDFMGESWLTNLLGRHLISGLYSDQQFDSYSKDWAAYMMSPSWDLAVGDSVQNIRAGTRSIPQAVYISNPLFDASSASGLQLTPVKHDVRPTGAIDVRYFDSHWKWSMDSSAPNYLDPAAVWMNPAVLPNGEESTQSENPSNYVGWTQGNFDILSTSTGDIDQLYKSASKLSQINKSEGITLQSFLWDDMIVGTIGWRRDELTLRSGTGQLDSNTGAVNPDFDLDPGEETASGTNRSWGVVVHQPKSLRDKLPLGTKVSLTYSDGRNVQVANRFAFDGSKLGNVEGSTEDYGFVIDTLDDRLRLKMVWYETYVKDANISSVVSAESALGSSAAGVWQFSKWALGSAMQGLAGMAGDSTADPFAYLWNWAATADPGLPGINDVTSDAFLSHPETISQKNAIAAFVAGMPEQTFWDAYAVPVNVAAARAGDYNTAITGGWNVGQGNWAIGGNQSINGIPPTGTVDNRSKGVEIEIMGKITDNWNISVNASKQTASQLKLGEQFVKFIESMNTFYASPAGDLRLWWGGDERVGDVWDRTIGAAYRFQKETTGKMVPEMSPWRANIVTNYSFKEGSLKGFNVGGGYRWQKGQILGYALKSDGSNLDVNKPYWGENQSSIDVWCGYERKLTDRINWRIQMNIRNLGKDVGLLPISVQPDGNPAMQRIVEGQIWSVTNTLTF